MTPCYPLPPFTTLSHPTPTWHAAGTVMANQTLPTATPALTHIAFPCARTRSLKNLSRNDIVEVRSLNNPPAGVKLVMEAACIMFDEKPKLKEDPTKMGARVRAVKPGGRCLRTHV